MGKAYLLPCAAISLFLLASSAVEAGYCKGGSESLQQNLPFLLQLLSSKDSKCCNNSTDIYRIIKEVGDKYGAAFYSFFSELTGTVTELKDTVGALKDSVELLTDKLKKWENECPTDAG